MNAQWGIHKKAFLPHMRKIGLCPIVHFLF